MKIDILVPVELSDDWLKVVVQRYAKYAMADTVFQGHDITSFKADGKEAYGSPDTMLRMANKAQAEGSDTCIIDCFTDPGLEQCSNQLTIPVVGVGQAGMSLAKIIGRRFAIITTEESIVNLIEQKAARYGVESNLLSVTAIGMPFHEVPQHSDEALERVKDHIFALLDEVEVFLLGCTELAELANLLCSSLRGINQNLMVINPLEAATHLAESLALASCS